MYGRYIDDLQKTEFVQYINNNNVNLKFTDVYCKSDINFLDVILTSASDVGCRRPTSTNYTLLVTSCHAPHT